MLVISLDAMPVPLTSGRHAWIDQVDVEWASQFNWYELVSTRSKTTYATTGYKGRTPSMHRLIAQRAGIVGFPTVDHVDTEGLNNTRANLRGATLVQQQSNRGLRSSNKSGYKGVNRWKPARGHSGRGWWMARITIAGVRRPLGLFETAEAAARVYDAWAKEVHGEFARLNFPEVG